MPYRNQLAPPSSNRLGDEVLSLDPMLMPPPYAPPQSLSGRLENLSIGLGRGKAQGLEGLYQMVTQPRATAQAIAQFAREVSDDPGVVLEMLRQARQKAMSGSLGLGELIGENVSVSNMLRRPKPPTQKIVIDLELERQKRLKARTERLQKQGRATPVDLSEGPFESYKDLADVDDFVTNQPELLERLMKKKLVETDPVIKSIEPIFGKGAYRIRFEDDTTFAVKDLEISTLREIVNQHRQDLLYDQVPENLRNLMVSDIIEILELRGKSESYIRDVLAGKIPFKLLRGETLQRNK